MPRDLPWSEWAKRFHAGFEDVWNEGQKVGLDVFFGWEQCYADDEYLVYGLDLNWLIQHPEIATCTRQRQLELIHEGGGCVIQAHPFRFRAYNRYVRLGLRFCDGIEAANKGNVARWDVYARHMGLMYRKVMTAGSDNHDSTRIGPNEDVFGVALEKKLSCGQDYARVILKEKERLETDQSLSPEHTAVGLHVPDGRFELAEGEQEPEDSWFLDEHEQRVPTHLYFDTYPARQV
ncbi:MAG: hypothetical protein IJ083_13770 [Clostridia bacterium]|nr:hypothetical protein [Clostridia bacterium]